MISHKKEEKDLTMDRSGQKISSEPIMNKCPERCLKEKERRKEGGEKEREKERERERERDTSE